MVESRNKKKEKREIYSFTGTDKEHHETDKMSTKSLETSTTRPIISIRRAEFIFIRLIANELFFVI